eukprot:364111-Chlamydomonas_euryale.AAC.5
MHAIRPDMLSPLNPYQAGLFMLALLFPNNKAAKERREDCIKLGVIETCVTIISKGKPEEITPALNIIACLAGVENGLWSSMRIGEGCAENAGCAL